MVADLEDLVAWCTKASLLRSRNKVYELILEFEPDHEKARYWLRYERRGDRWERPGPYREPLDRNAEAASEFAKRRAAIVARWEERLLPIIEQEGPERHAAIALLLTGDPANKRARSANGEVEWRGRWVLEETPRAFQRRAEFQRIAGTALRAVPAPERDAPTESERELGLRWTCAYQGLWWRTVSTVPDREEVLHALRAADAAAELVSRAIPDEMRPLTHEGMSVFQYGAYYLASRDEGMRFLARHPAFTDADRRFAKALSGCWVPKTNQRALWRDVPAGRRDGMCRSAVSASLTRRYGYFEKGWIEEGFGLYLTHLLVGTRLTYFVAQTEYALADDGGRKVDLLHRMQEHDSNWLALARTLGRPDLRFLASKGLNEMTSQDVLWSHALAAYLLEGRAEGLSEFLGHCVRLSLDEALKLAYGMTVADLDARLIRWLGEAA